MIDFRKPLLSDRDWVTRHMLLTGERGAEFNFANLLLWARAYDQRIALAEDHLLIRVSSPLGPAYFWPAGAGDPAPALSALEAHCQEQGEPLRFVCLSQVQAKFLEALRPGRFSVLPDRDGWDYLYDVNKLADLGGRKLHSKRNHCKHFEEENPSWRYEALTPAALDECLALDAEWDRRSREREGPGEALDMSNEKFALQMAARNFEALGLEGGVLRVEGALVAFTMGSPICPDTFDVHFEKAYGDLQGAFPVINREFARQVRARHPEVVYLNREDDMGLEGLRKAKLSYYPDLMVEKFRAERI